MIIAIKIKKTAAITLLTITLQFYLSGLFSLTKDFHFYPSTQDQRKKRRKEKDKQANKKRETEKGSTAAESSAGKNGVIDPQRIQTRKRGDKGNARGGNEMERELCRASGG